MEPLAPALADALSSLTAMLAADNYRLIVHSDDTGTIVAEIEAGPGACPTCLVPKEMMRLYVENALRGLSPDRPEIRLIYPADRA